MRITMDWKCRLEGGGGEKCRQFWWVNFFFNKSEIDGHDSSSCFLQAFVLAVLSLQGLEANQVWGCHYLHVIFSVT
jgi:hypothetical protein